MNVRRHTLAAALLAALAPCLRAQTAPAAADTEAGRGRVILEMYTHARAGFGADSDTRGFHINWFQLGYRHNLGRGAFARAQLEVDDGHEGNDHSVGLKYAHVGWTGGAWTLMGGVIPTLFYSLIDDYWTFYYTIFNPQDEHGFAPSSDLGVSAQWAPLPWLELDGIVTNGEGHTHLQRADGMQYGLGLTLRPAPGAMARLYASLNENPGMADTHNYSAFAGYHDSRLMLSAEVSAVRNYAAARGHHRYVAAAYGSLRLSRTVQAFARFDRLWSDGGWDAANDGSLLLAGAEVEVPRLNLKIAPSLRYQFRKQGADGGFVWLTAAYEM